jgi:membrane glycosyltransferase
MSLADSFFRATTRPATGRLNPRVCFVGMTVGFASIVLVAFAGSITAWTPMAVMAIPLVFASAVWIAGGAATALVGVMFPKTSHRGLPAMLGGWDTSAKTAILVTLCGEEPEPVARYLLNLRTALDRATTADATPIFVLSDTSGTDAIAAEEAALQPVIAGSEISYRRRMVNTGRKPGNIADWLHEHGDGFEFMLVLDADSRMSALRICDMIRTLEARPNTGLLQAGISLAPGKTRFDRHQRVSSRFLSPNFVRGFAVWTGRTGNYWGHNAIMRVSAFRSAARLPMLSGQAPLGGAILSHDFVEAAWMRRAGWAVELDPCLAGSAEMAPQTLEAFHRRDRRWCQGNLQHVRLLTERGLHPISRFHFLSGVFSYLAAPIWLVLMAMIASGAITVAGGLPFALVAILLLLPKLCALPGLLSRARTLGRRTLILRAAISEIVISALLAPLVMIRQTVSIASVLLGRDCGWKSGTSFKLSLPVGALEALSGVAILGLALIVGTETTVYWLAPLILPLISAPALIRYLDAPA